MNLRVLALTLTAWLLLGGATVAAPYTVQPGDTLYSLAKRFVTTPAALQAANKLSSTGLRVGQILEIPERVHTVQKGETLYGVARLYAVAVSALRDLNALSDDAVQIGQKLTIPWNFSAGSSPAPTSVSSLVQMPISSPVPPPLLPLAAPIVIPSPGLHPAPAAPDLNALPPVNTAQIAVVPERPLPSLPNGPQAARSIPPLRMPSSAALPSISVEAALTPSSRLDAPTLIHTVQSGDTLFNIARRYNVSITNIRLENALESDSLALGQRLSIPATLTVMNAPQPSDLRDIAGRYLGVTYVYGGSSASGLDCSGFVSIVFRELGVTLPRTSFEQFAAGIAVSQADLESGDLVFFDTLGRGAVSHVGIYLGGGEFIHAASNPGKVVTSRLEENYYAARYLGARRVLLQD